MFFHGPFYAPNDVLHTYTHWNKKMERVGRNPYGKSRRTQKDGKRRTEHKKMERVDGTQEDGKSRSWKREGWTV